MPHTMDSVYELARTIRPFANYWRAREHKMNGRVVSCEIEIIESRGIVCGGDSWDKTAANLLKCFGYDGEPGYSIEWDSYPSWRESADGSTLE